MTGERVVVAAPYPTMPGPEAAHTFAVVRSLVAEGADVTVVSPAPSAAHHHADPGGARGAARLAALTRGADRLILRLDAAALAVDTDSPRALAGRLAIAAAVRAARSCELRLDRVPDRVSRQWAALVVAPAERVVVGSDSERAALVEAAVAPARVVVEPEPPGEERATLAGRRAPIEPVPVPDSPDPSQLEDLLRRRAAADRAANRWSSSGGTGSASRPLRHLARMERAPVRSAKPAGVLIKRVLAKLLAWQFDNVIEHVNRLHDAAIAAIEAVEAQRAEAPAPAESSDTSASAADRNDRSKA